MRNSIGHVEAVGLLPRVAIQDLVFRCQLPLPCVVEPVNLEAKHVDLLRGQGLDFELQMADGPPSWDWDSSATWVEPSAVPCQPLNPDRLGPGVEVPSRLRLAIHHLEHEALPRNFKSDWCLLTWLV